MGKELFGILEYDDIMVDVNGKITDEFEQAVTKTMKDCDSVIHYSYNVGMEDSIKQLLGMVIMICYIVFATAFVGFCNMSNTIKANILSRNKENGMLRAMGMSNKMLIKLICLENVKMALYSSGISIILAFPVQAHFSVIMLGEISIKVWACIIIIALAMISSFLLSYHNAKKCVEQNIIGSIREL
jgi:putative ABC transport system permease protein